MGERLGEVLGQAFVIENQSGGGGLIASQAVTRAAPDGYTLMLGYVGTHGTNPAVRKLPYDAVKGFTAIGMVGGTPNVLVVSPQTPVKSVKELIAYAKANPTALSYGSAGAGTLTHLVMEQFKEATQTSMSHVPYRGISPAMMDVLGNHTQVLFPGLAAALSQIRADKLLPLAVTGARRHPLLPEVPTLEELGLKGFEMTNWYGLMAPGSTPRALVNQINADGNRVMKEPAIREKLAAVGTDIGGGTPEEFDAFLRSELAKYARLVKATGVVVDN
jgi:tripartite-type tricarboxylate transporter receptor subunit TctC